ncbi:NADH pyrophosphatase [Frankia canadensis]|uniref:NAD(+) diphosphatase n=1 Tax=Frankia canadensis TaxID=1836972 RepID=A0A2I2KQP6_9ACTN|nr:NAD(+) diphosphatase [Frankia canadensis]SNQ47970.1 NADH pyrophosphatase [Frankia canadensis]SOU55260.1 NADH pyrophosphatase [Frankia canadensis]
MTDFGLVRTPTFAGAALVRDEPQRQDPDRQKEGWATARVIVVDDEGRAPVVWPDPPPTAEAPAGPWLWTRVGAELAGAPPADALLLGEVDGIAHWAVRGERERAAVGDDPAVRWSNLAVVGAELGPHDSALLAAAVALLGWHERARFCARDGSPTRLINAGWARVCEAESHEEYPRTDPAVIVLVHDGADRMLLGRHRNWPAGRFSVLAGFVEAGESLEACVAREIAEEVGIDVTDIRYLGSQAWPFPRSLMIGYHAVADPEQPLRLDETEICEAMWLTRDDLRTALARGDWRASPGAAGSTGGSTASTGSSGLSGRGEALGEAVPVRLPGPISIARNMIDSWVAAG